MYEGNLLTGDSGDTCTLRYQDIGNSDYSGDYSMSFKTVDFDFGNSIEKKVLKRVYVTLKSEERTGQNIDLSLNYYIDGSTTAYSLSSADLGEAVEPGLFVAKFPVPIDQAATFRWLSLGMSYTGNQGPIKIYGIKAIYRPLDWD